MEVLRALVLLALCVAASCVSCCELKPNETYIEAPCSELMSHITALDSCEAFMEGPGLQCCESVEEDEEDNMAMLIMLGFVFGLTFLFFWNYFLWGVAFLADQAIPFWIRLVHLRGAGMVTHVLPHLRRSSEHDDGEGATSRTYQAAVIFNCDEGNVLALDNSYEWFNRSSVDDVDTLPLEARAVVCDVRGDSVRYAWKKRTPVTCPLLVQGIFVSIIVGCFMVGPTVAFGTVVWIAVPSAAPYPNAVWVGILVVFHAWLLRHMANRVANRAHASTMLLGAGDDSSVSDALESTYLCTAATHSFAGASVAAAPAYGYEAQSLVRIDEGSMLHKDGQTWARLRPRAEAHWAPRRYPDGASCCVKLGGWCGRSWRGPRAPRPGDEEWIMLGQGCWKCCAAPSGTAPEPSLQPLQHRPPPSAPHVVRMRLPHAPSGSAPPLYEPLHDDTDQAPPSYAESAVNISILDVSKEV